MCSSRGWSIHDVLQFVFFQESENDRTLSDSKSMFFFVLFFYLLLRRSIADHYLRSCGYVACSRPQQTANGGLKPGTSRPKVLGFTTCRHAIAKTSNKGWQWLGVRYRIFTLNGYRSGTGPLAILARGAVPDF